MLSSFYRRLAYRRLSTFGLSSPLLRRGAIYCLVATFYPCEDDSDMQDKFDQSKISNYSHFNIEELEL